MTDYYQLLGVSQTALLSEIRNSFRKKAKAHHPDLHQNSSPQEQKKHQKRFIQLSQAYETLSNTQARQKYDQQRNSQKQSKQRQSTARPRSQARSQSSTRSRSKSTSSSEFKYSTSYSRNAPPEDDDTLDDLIRDVEDLLRDFSLEFHDPLEMLLQWARRIFKDSAHESNEYRDTFSSSPPFSGTGARNSFYSSSFMHEVEEELKRLKCTVQENPKKRSSQGTKIDEELEMLKKKFRKA